MVRCHFKGHVTTSFFSIYAKLAVYLCSLVSFISMANNLIQLERRSIEMMEETKEEPLKETTEHTPVVETAQKPEEKLAELNDKFLRLYSEFENYKKRTTRERLEFVKFAGEEVITSMLPVLDDLERALKAGQSSSDKTFVEGIQLIHHKFLNSLKQKGVEEIKTEKEIFNTDIHEAITNIPAPSEDLKGKVVECVEKGYYLNGKVIRFAKVVVGI